MKNLYAHIKKSISDKCFPVGNSEVKIDVRGLQIPASFTETEVRAALIQICHEMAVKGVDATFYIWFSMNWQGYIKLSREKQPRMIYTYNNDYEVYGICFEYQRPHGWESFELAKKMAGNTQNHFYECSHKPKEYHIAGAVIAAAITAAFVTCMVLIAKSCL